MNRLRMMCLMQPYFYLTLSEFESDNASFEYVIQYDSIGREQIKAEEKIKILQKLQFSKDVD